MQRSGFGIPIEIVRQTEKRPLSRFSVQQPMTNFANRASRSHCLPTLSTGGVARPKITVFYNFMTKIFSNSGPVCNFDFQTPALIYQDGLGWMASGPTWPE
jgi:hypothetical protein